MTRTQYQGGSHLPSALMSQMGTWGPSRLSVLPCCTKLLLIITRRVGVLSPRYTIQSTFGPSGRGYFTDKIFQVCEEECYDNVVVVVIGEN